MTTKTRPKKIDINKKIRDRIITLFKSAGLQYKELNNPKIEGLAFYVTLDDNRKKIYFYLSKDRQVELINSAFDNKIKQVVLTVKEQKRTIVLKEPISKKDLDSNIRISALYNKIDDRIGLLNLGGATSYNDPPHINSSETFIEAKVYINASTTTLLMGLDEEHYFISALPKTAKSIKEAHKVLIPTEVKRAIRSNLFVKRQGEFFFVPISKKKLTKLLKESVNTYLSTDEPIPKNNEVSDHFSTVLMNIIRQAENKRAKSITIVTGTIINDRHNDLILHTPHIVYCNTEIPAPDDAIFD